MPSGFNSRAGEENRGNDWEEEERGKRDARDEEEEEEGLDAKGGVLFDTHIGPEPRMTVSMRLLSRCFRGGDGARRASESTSHMADM
ncbi:hypothetical protein EYF80_040831 [Liparis tanakae]|uniref:Uncharacterized protein n=1 Tax=Liparis tanakae TaxID=230148 RepID=A0A4Z2G6Q2_9TELE|nr:hypothetical protein EYF80_040831 [Liparis tanakae]